MRTSFVLAAAGALLTGFVGLATPASAVCDPALGCTGVQFTVSGGTISISAQASATAGSSAPSTGGTLDISLGSTSVTDSRVPTTGWTLNATASDFTTSGAAATITKSNAAFSVPAAPSPSSGCTFTQQTTFLAVNSLTGTTTAPILTCVATGSNSATYVPHLQVTVPASSVAGVYSGTVTQSVS